MNPSVMSKTSTQSDNEDSLAFEYGKVVGHIEAQLEANTAALKRLTDKVKNQG